MEMLFCEKTILVVESYSRFEWDSLSAPHSEAEPVTRKPSVKIRVEVDMSAYIQYSSNVIHGSTSKEVQIFNTTKDLKVRGIYF